MSEITRTVLLVDDEPDLCEILSFDFEEAGFKTFTAHNGKEALQIVKTQDIDAVVSDIRMPGGDGVEMLEAIREIHPDRPVVMLVTGFADITIEQAYDKGAEAIFFKPVDIQKLIEAVSHSLIPERERWTRKSNRFEAEIHIEVNLTSLGKVRESHTLNIGRGGLFLAFEQNLPKVGDLIEFRIRFEEEKEDWREISGTGVVRWVRESAEGDEFPQGAGIEFSDLTDGTRAVLMKLINSIATKTYIPRS